jgi:hypothetical protein
MSIRWIGSANVQVDEYGVIVAPPRYRRDVYTVDSDPHIHTYTHNLDNVDPMVQASLKDGATWVKVDVHKVTAVDNNTITIEIRGIASGIISLLIHG